MSWRAAPLAAGAALLTWSCGIPLMTLPTGPGTPTDATAALSAATERCRAIHTLSAEIAVRGSIGGQRVRARLIVGASEPDALRVEALAPFGRPGFIVVVRGGEATVVFADDRVLEHGEPAAVLDALIGVPLDAGALLPMLTGCATSPEARRARAFGESWFLVPDGSTELFLRRDSDTAAWRVVAAVHHPSSGPAWRVEYREFGGGLPQSVRLERVAEDPFDLRLSLSQVTFNEPLGPDVFQVRVPEGAVPIGIDQLALWGR